MLDRNTTRLLKKLKNCNLQIMDISTPYYSDVSRISNSNIGWFLQKGPAYLHKMLTEDVPEEKSPALERGSMIHMYILQPEEFQKTYVVWDKSRPSSGQQEEFCQALANSLEIEPNKAVLDAYKKAYSTKGKSEDTMLSEGLKIASTLKDYIDFIKADDGRTMIGPWDYHMLKEIENNIQSHKLANKIVWPIGKGKAYSIDGIMKQIDSILYTVDETGHPIENVMSFHEFHINWEYLTAYGSNAEQDEDPQGVREVHCKSLLDGLTLDFKNKKVIIYDLKTTQKLWHFEDSIDQYDYLRQLCYYTMAADWYLENELGQTPGTWDHDYYIIGIDTTGSNEIRVFKIDGYIVDSKIPVIENALTEIAWHQSIGKWDHSREYYEGDGSETLNL